MQEFGLPTDGSADDADADGDLLSNSQEWIAGPVPTNASSVLRLLGPTHGVSGVIVSWQSVSTMFGLIEFELLTHLTVQ